MSRIERHDPSARSPDTSLKAGQAAFRHLLIPDLSGPAIPDRSTEEFGYAVLRNFIENFPSIITIIGMQGFSARGMRALAERERQLQLPRDKFREDLGQTLHFPKVRNKYLGPRGKSTFAHHVADSYVELVRPFAEKDEGFAKSSRDIVQSTRRKRTNLYDSHWRDFLVYCPSVRKKEHTGYANLIKLIFMQDFANQIAMEVIQKTFTRYTSATVMFQSEEEALTRLDEHIQNVEEVLKPVMAVRIWRMTNSGLLVSSGTPHETIHTLETVAFMTNSRPQGINLSPLSHDTEYTLLHQAMLEMIEKSLQSGEWGQAIDFIETLQEYFSKLFPSGWSVKGYKTVNRQLTTEALQNCLKEEEKFLAYLPIIRDCSIR